MTYVSKREKIFELPNYEHLDCTPKIKRSDGRLKQFSSIIDDRAWSLNEKKRYSYLYYLVTGSQTCLEKFWCHKYVPLEDLLNLLLIEKNEYIKKLEKQAVNGQVKKRSKKEKPLDELFRTKCFEDDEEVSCLKTESLTAELCECKTTSTRKVMCKLENIDEIVNEIEKMKTKLKYSEEMVKFLREKKCRLEKELENLRPKSQIQVNLQNAQQTLQMMEKEQFTEGEELMKLAIERDNLKKKVTELQNELIVTREKQNQMELMQRKCEFVSMTLEEMMRENEDYKKKLMTMKCLERQIQELKKQANLFANKYKKDLESLREERNKLKRRVNKYEMQYNDLKTKLQQVDSIIAEKEILNNKLASLDKLELENELLRCKLEQCQLSEMKAAESKEKIMELQCAVADQEEEMKDLLCQIEKLTRSYDEGNELDKLKEELSEKVCKLKVCEERLAKIPFLEAEINELRSKLEKQFEQSPNAATIKKKVVINNEMIVDDLTEIGARYEENVDFKKQSIVLEDIKTEEALLLDMADKYRGKDWITCEEVQNLPQASKGIISCILEDMIEHKKEMEDLEKRNQEMKEEIEILKTEMGKSDMDVCLQQVIELKLLVQDKQRKICCLEQKLKTCVDREKVNDHMNKLEREIECLRETNNRMRNHLEEACGKIQRCAELENMLEEERHARAASETKDADLSKMQKEEFNLEAKESFSNDTDAVRSQMDEMNKLIEELKKENSLLKETIPTCPNCMKELDEKHALETLLNLLQNELDTCRRNISDDCETLRKEVKRLKDQNCQLKILINCYKEQLELENSLKEGSFRKVIDERIGSSKDRSGKSPKGKCSKCLREEINKSTKESTCNSQKSANSNILHNENNKLRTEANRLHCEITTLWAVIYMKERKICDQSKQIEKLIACIKYLVKKMDEKKLQKNMDENFEQEADENLQQDMNEKAQKKMDKKFQIQVDENLQQRRSEKLEKDREEKLKEEQEERLRNEKEEKLQKEEEEKLRVEKEEELREEKEEKPQEEKEERLREEKEEKPQEEKEERLREEKEEQPQEEKEEKLRQEKEEKPQEEKEERLRKEKEEKLQEEEEKRLRREKEKKLQKEEEERLRKEKEEKLQEEEEKRLRREKEKKLQKEEEERLRREKEEKLQKEEEERLRREKEEKLQKEEEKRLQREKEEKLQKEEEEILRREKEEKLQKEEEERLRKMKETKSQEEKGERLRKEKEEKTQEEMGERLRKEKEEKLQKEEEKRLRREKEEKLQKEEEEILRKEKEEKLQKEEEERLRKMKETKSQEEKGERLRKEKEEKTQGEEEERLRKEKEVKSQEENEERLRKRKEEKLQEEKEERLRKEKEEKLQKVKEGRLQEKWNERLQKSENIELENEIKNLEDKSGLQKKLKECEKIEIERDSLLKKQANMDLEIKNLKERLEEYAKNEKEKEKISTRENKLLEEMTSMRQQCAIYQEEANKAKAVSKKLENEVHELKKLVEGYSKERANDTVTSFSVPFQSQKVSASVTPITEKQRLLTYEKATVEMVTEEGAEKQMVTDFVAPKESVKMITSKDNLRKSSRVLRKEEKPTSFHGFKKKEKPVATHILKEEKPEASILFVENDSEIDISEVDPDFQNFLCSLNPVDHKRNICEIEKRYRKKMCEFKRKYDEKVKFLVDQFKKERNLQDKIFNNNMSTVRSGYETDIRKLIEQHKTSIMRLQSLHEDEIRELNVNYKTQMKAVRSQSENVANNLTNSVADKYEDLAEQQNKDVREAEKKYQKLLYEKELHLVGQIPKSPWKLNQNTKNVEENHNETMENVTETLQGNIIDIQTKYNREMKKLKQSNMKRMNVMRYTYEDLLMCERKKYEKQLEDMIQRLRQGRSIADGICQCRFENSCDPKDPNAPLEFNDILEKILSEGLTSLAFNEVALVHRRTCAATEDIILNPDVRVELLPPIADDACARSQLMNVNKNELLKRILILENDIASKQMETQDAINNMELAIKTERKRLQKLRDSLQSEKKKNSETKCRLSKPKLNLDYKRINLSDIREKDVVTQRCEFALVTERKYITHKRRHMFPESEKERLFIEESNPRHKSSMRKKK